MVMLEMEGEGDDGRGAVNILCTPPARPIFTLTLLYATLTSFSLHTALLSMCPHLCCGPGERVDGVAERGRHLTLTLFQRTARVCLNEPFSPPSPFGSRENPWHSRLMQRRGWLGRPHRARLWHGLCLSTSSELKGLVLEHPLDAISN